MKNTRRIRLLFFAGMSVLLLFLSQNTPSLAVVTSNDHEARPT